jgi:hypothetical protein
MSTSRTVALTIHFDVVSADSARRVSWTPQEWRTKARTGVTAHGRPTVENIARFVTAMEASLAPGGCNAHISGRMGVDTIVKAWIVDQSTGETVATWFKK